MSDTSENTATPREKPLNELLSNSLVDIYIGPDSNHWVLHEKLLCHHSPFFRARFYDPKNQSASSKTFGLEDCDDLPFELLVGWLYSKALRYPEEEKDIGALLDLYFLAEKFEMAKLSEDVVETIRAFYHNNETYPALRRVQYVYANTEEDNILREMMVSSVARYLTLADVMPPVWEKALKRNGQLAVDIIRSIQQWHLEGKSLPDARDASQDRGRSVGFAAVEEGSSLGSVKEEDSEHKTNGIH
ncbi:MAG: hypothetical protein Q9195_003363 [Heterodermia aff. obscurata]